MVRKFVAAAVKAVILLWLIGWFLAVGPRAAWLDVAHLASGVYAWVHTAIAHTNAPPTATTPS